jgi:hypothetical protein
MPWLRALAYALAAALLLVGCTSTTSAPLSIIVDAPVPAAIDVDPAVVIQVRFGVDIGSLPAHRFTLADEGGTPVAGEVAYAANTATFTPNAPLAEGTTYVATIRAPIRAAGRVLASDFSWTFTTRTTIEPVTVTLTNLNHVYDATAKEPTVTAVPAVAYSVTYDGASDAPSAAGSYAVIVTVTAPGFGGGASGTLVIAPKALTLGGLTAADKVYDGTTAVTIVGDATLTGVVAGDDAALAADLAFAFASANVGAAVAVVAQGDVVVGADAANYALAPLDLAAAITARAIEIVPEAGQGKTYGEVDPALRFAANGLVAGDQLTGELTRAAGEDVGTYAFLLGTLTGNDNYALAFPADAARFTIDPRILRIHPDPGQGKEFQEPDPVLTFTAEGLIGDDVATGALGRVAGEAIGTYDYTLGGASAGANYALALTGTERFEVRRRLIVVTPDAGQVKALGEADPAFTFTHTALLDGDDLEGEIARVAGETVGEYPFTLGTLTAPAIYEVVLAADAPTFRIAPLVVTITPTAGQGKTYGDEDPPLTYDAVGLAEGDVLTGALARLAGEDAGEYAFVLGTLDAGPEYALTIAPNPEPFTIAPRTVTVTPSANQKKVFGDADPDLFTFEATGVLPDDEALEGAMARVAGENVGVYAFTIGTLSAGTNYDVVIAAGAPTFAITPLPVTIQPVAGQSKVQGTPDPATFAFTLSPTVPEGALTGTIGRVAGETVGTYAYTLNTFGGNPNYALSIAPGSFFTITAE